jgi:hypothetical protein
LLTIRIYAGTISDYLNLDKKTRHRNVIDASDFDALGDIRTVPRASSGVASAPAELACRGGGGVLGLARGGGGGSMYHSRDQAVVAAAFSSACEVEAVAAAACRGGGAGV